MTKAIRPGAQPRPTPMRVQVEPCPACGKEGFDRVRRDALGTSRHVDCGSAVGGPEPAVARRLQRMASGYFG